MNLLEFLKKPDYSEYFKSQIDSKFPNLSKGYGVIDYIRLLTVISILKYVHRSTIREIKVVNGYDFTQFKGPNHLSKLVELDLLTYKKDFYSVTEKTNQLLLNFKLDSIFLPKKLQGDGEKDSLMNSKYLIDAFNIPDFYCLLYKNFEKLKPEALRPDAVLIRKREDKIKLDFIEIEKDKDSHKDYLDKKIIKYLKLSESSDALSWWNGAYSSLGLSYKSKYDFKFGVIIVTSRNLVFEKGIKCINNFREL